MNITIEIIPHEKQRYPTVGDWQYDKNGNLKILVSKMHDERFEMLVAVHELIEVLMCRHDGVSQELVDGFDMEFEKNRKPDGDSEPGDDPAAPYHFQHSLATGIERILAVQLSVPWEDYAKAVEALP